MSNVFDTVQQKNLSKQLKTILDPDGLHIKILLKDVKLNINIGQEMGDEITTNTGVPQGDCLTPILFTLHLADAIKKRSMITRENKCSKVQATSEDLLPECLRDHQHSLHKEDGLLSR